MSVMMGLRIEVDVERFKAVIAENGDKLEEITARSREYGAIHHHFSGNANGAEVLVVDEWPDAESCGKFFAASPDIPELFGQAGVTNEPTPVFWNAIDAPGSF